MTIPPRAAERVTWPEGCPVPVYRDTGTMVQALVNCSRRRPRPAGWPLNSRLRVGSCGKPRTDAPPARWAIVPQVAAGIVNSITDPYPLRPQPTHSESVEQKATAGVVENDRIPPLAEYITQLPDAG